jgi:isopenicillin-N epimerase
MNFGHAMRVHWALDPEVTFLNHGSFGATPRALLSIQRQWQDRLEHAPVDFQIRQLPGLLRHAADQIAPWLGADGSDLVFVQNATAACNAVLRSVRLEPGDRVVTLDHVYPAVHNLLRFVCERAGAELVCVELPCPEVDERWIDALDRALAGARLAVLDHITSASGLVLPIERLVALCNTHGVPVLVDGAHGPGQVDLDLNQLGATWYTGNLHKWLCAPKGCAVLWTAPHAQGALHSHVVSHGYQQGVAAEFDWPGTLDPSPWLTAPAALEFRRSFGDAAWSTYTHQLALTARQILLDGLDLPAVGGGDRVGTMAAVLLPEHVGGSMEQAIAFQHRLVAAGFEAPVSLHRGRLLLRVSAQVYNQRSDYEELTQALQQLLR